MTDLETLVGTEPEDPVAGRRRQAVRIVSLVLWAAVVVFQTAMAIISPGAFTIVLAVAVFVLCAAMNAQIVLMLWTGNRNWSRMAAKLHGSAYLSELNDLPNRNYLLAEIRREMPRARETGHTFTLVQVSFDTLDEVAERRGAPFCDRAINALTELLKRVTRQSDFVSHTSGPRFVVMLNECTMEQSWIYLQRIPATIAVSDGRMMYEVPLSVRLAEYDMESLYATDVVRDVEESPPLRRREDLNEKRTWTEAA
ncbi:MAG: diguanylate cyclase [Dehalococcoidia bacterium]|nr:diguanylate cyclase [Dehalococcoidia bacterium]MCL4231420.1 diguanylate cyclase [Dehalococcoidia bacterium]NUQ54870.1 diguanylate cyclase [Dehalococcoidia bacterium]